MLDDKDYSDISLKAVTYPIVVVLNDLINDLLAVKSSDADKGALGLLEWTDRLTATAKKAAEMAASYSEGLGFSMGCWHGDDDEIEVQKYNEINLSNP